MTSNDKNKPVKPSDQIAEESTLSNTESTVSTDSKIERRSDDQFSSKDKSRSESDLQSKEIIESKGRTKMAPMPRKNLCTNCGEKLGGQFCHGCGQSSKSMIKFFGEVAKELLDDTLGYDSRLKHSIFPLLFRPGRITIDYIKGKRFHYVLPFKLYLITSVLLILLIKMVADSNELKFDNIVDNDVAEEIKEDVNQEINQALGEIQGAGDNPHVKSFNINIDQDENTGKTSENKSTDSKDKNSEKSINEIDKKEGTNLQVETDSGNRLTLGSDGDDNVNWDSDKQELIGLGDLDESWYKDFLVVINPKIKEWRNDPGPLMERFIESLPYMMFVILPIFAMFLKLFYAFSRRFYTEHLVFLLHNHSFLYMVLMLQIFLNFLEEKVRILENTSTQMIVSTVDWLSIILAWWMVIYVFLAMKRFYRQGWGITILKTSALGFIYTLMLIFGFVITLAVGAYQA